MIQRAVKLSKNKRKGDKAEAKVSRDAESDLTDIEDEEDITTKPKKAKINPTAAKKSTKK